jgi:branched-chain amino acid transport system ATP-binding protein
VVEIARTGVAILLVEQFAGFVLGVAHQVAVMTQGRIRHAGRPDEVSAELSGAYLGGHAQ